MISNSPTPADTAHTRIAIALAAETQKFAGKAGFKLIPEGLKALAARLQLADHAEVCIDTQYYEIDDDLAGHLFIEALLRAANRGVRVRLLLDDYRTKGYESNLVTLRDHPNFEMRIYNPFRNRRSRIFESVTSFSRVNRRMHNKSFTVDNQITLIGGRNIGDPYFNVSEEVNFADLDILGIGPVVNDVSNMFDEYWNSHAAIPISDLARSFGKQKVSIESILQQFTKSRANARQSAYADILDSLMFENLRKDLTDFIWAKYRLAYDRPEKTQNKKDSALIRRLLIEAFDEAEKDVVLISPYFVPRLSGLKRFAQLRNRKVDVTVVTNSLASNNQIYAHGGYAPVRKQLLKMGVKLFELSSSTNVVRANQHGSRPGNATLHTKAFAIDHKKLFIGSFNFDPRSANINTEMGVFIESEELATSLVHGTQRYSRTQSYQLKLTKKNRIRWHQWKNQEEIVVSHEPHSSFWRRVCGQIARLLPIRGQV